LNDLPTISLYAAAFPTHATIPRSFVLWKLKHATHFPATQSYLALFRVTSLRAVQARIAGRDSAVAKLAFSCRPGSVLLWIGVVWFAVLMPKRACFEFLSGSFGSTRPSHSHKPLPWCCSVPEQSGFGHSIDTFLPFSSYGCFITIFPLNKMLDCCFAALS